MKFFPESALVQLEFDKIKALLEEHCNSLYAKEKAQELRIHTRKEYIELELRQSHEYMLLTMHAMYFPNDYILNLSKELQLLGIDGAVLSGEQFVQIRKLAESIQQVFRWFNPERKLAYPALAQVIQDTRYEKIILELIDAILDRSEERRVGKECRSRWGPYDERQNHGEE